MNILGKSYWKDHSEAWKTSNMTQQAYCEQAGISYPSFVYQHNRINRNSKSSTLNFIEAKPELAVINNQNAGLQLILPNGIRIGIGGEVNDALLQSVLRIAGGITC
jgi:hypothetical protein